MARSRFVKPEVTRLYLADVHRRAHQALIARKDPKPTSDEIAASAQRVQDAEADGAFIDVKRRLSAGEKHDTMERLAPTTIAGQRPVIKTKEIYTATILGYLLGWSFTDDAGRPVDYNPDMGEAQRLSLLRGLDEDTFEEIVAAIDAHTDAEDAARAIRKNNQDGANESPAVSPSPSTTAGAMSGSMS
jgi:hypothetical protein